MMLVVKMWTFNAGTSGSGVATGDQGGQQQVCQKSGKRGRKSVKIGKKRENREVSFFLPLLIDRVGYATDIRTHTKEKTSNIPFAMMSYFENITLKAVQSVFVKTNWVCHVRCNF